jgi:hypothetical protein
VRNGLRRRGAAEERIERPWHGSGRRLSAATARQSQRPGVRSENEGSAPRPASCRWNHESSGDVFIENLSVGNHTSRPGVPPGAGRRTVQRPSDLRSSPGTWKRPKQAGRTVAWRSPGGGEGTPGDQSRNRGACCRRAGARAAPPGVGGRRPFSPAGSGTVAWCMAISDRADDHHLRPAEGWLAGLAPCSWRRSRLHHGLFALPGAPPAARRFSRFTLPVLL